ncbi:hypothetical protein QYM36_010187, partial [Artemia franciscana]
MKNFGKVLVRLLENDLGQRFSIFASNSWHRAYDVIVEYIEEGLQQSYKQDPVTGITDAEKLLVQESWELLKPDLLGLGRKIFRVIFTKHPDYQILFTRVGFGDTPLTELENNPAFGEHIIKVMRSFDYVIRNLDKPKTLLAYLKKVGADHIARNVERRHFQAFSEALIPVMQNELQAQLRPEAVAAWRKGLDRIIGVIDQGLLGLKEINPQIAFSAADIAAIQRTWALAKPDLMGKGAIVFKQDLGSPTIWTKEGILSQVNSIFGVSSACIKVTLACKNAADLHCMVFYAMEQDEFCLKWTNYSNAYKGNFAALLNNEHFTDVTLSCENQNIKCHRLVLSACSSYFENLLISHSDSHPIIILKDIKFCDMQALVKFVYTGEVTVAQAQVKSLLSLADMLKVTGLTESGESSNKAKNTIYLVEGTEVSEASPSMERRRQDRDSEKDAFMHDSLMDSVSPIPPCTTGILLNNTNEIRPCSSVAQQNDVITVKSELTSEETAVSMSQFVNSCQDHSEGAGTPSLFIDNAASFNCSNVTTLLGRKSCDLQVVKSEVITDPCEETTGPMSNFVYNLQDYGEEAGTSVLSDDNIANFDFPGLEGCINISDELINVDENEDRNKDSTEVIEKKGIFAVDTEPRYQAINDDDKEEMDMNFGRVIVPSKGQDFSILMDYLPATKIKGGENSAEPLDEMKYFQSCFDYEVKVVKGKPISFPAMLNVYTREKGNDEELPEPRHGVLNTSGYYCMDGASILPVLALGINPGQSVLDMCSAPGGKMYVMLQTMHPSLIIANDASKARVRRIRNVLKSFVGNLEESLSTKVITSTIKAEHWTELDAFDKVLADVPCQTDRHSVIENDNNIFKPSRSRERITLPETQSGILT